MSSSRLFKKKYKMFEHGKFNGEAPYSFNFATGWPTGDARSSQYNPEEVNLNEARKQL